MRRQTVSQLFSGSGSTQYQVPIYQRRYVWDTENWETLWTDIENTTKKMLARESKDHFIGTIVTYPDQNRIPFQKHQIIDGQQRLITFQIIFCVIRDLCKLHPNGLTNIMKAADNRVRNEDPNCNPPEARYKLLPTTFDRCEFLAIVDPENPEYTKYKLPECEEDAKHLIHKAYFYFQRMIADHVKENHQNIESLFLSITTHFKFSPIDLEKSDDPQNIFAALNATGKMLYEFDYLRTDLFLRVERGENREAVNQYRKAVNQFYHNYWAILDESYWKTERLEQFLKCFLMAKLGPMDFQGKRLFHDVYKGQYHAKLRAKLNPRNEKEFEDISSEFLRQEFEELTEYAKTYLKLEDSTEYPGSKMQFYKDLGTYKNRDNNNSGIKFQHDLNITCVQSFILYLVHEVKISSKDLNTVFEILESYTARRFLVDTAIGSHAYDRINDFFKGLSSEKYKFTVESLVDFLTTRKTGKWITDDEVRERFRSSGNREQGAGDYFQNSLEFTECYLLYRIENLIRNDEKRNPLCFQDFPDTQERMLNSRKLGKAWASLGNKTFRTGGDRPRFNSFLPQKKLLEAPDNAKLMLNQKICDNSDWGPSEIWQRQQDLLDYFRRIWRPLDEIIKTPAVKSPKSKVSKPKVEPRWVSMIQSNSFYPVRFVTYGGPEVLSQIKVTQSQMEGIDESTKQKLKLKRTDILSACSARAWSNLQYKTLTRLSVQAMGLQPILNPTKQLQLDNAILQSAQDGNFCVTVLTRLGHELSGTISYIEDEAIHLQIEEHSVIVFKSSLLEFTIEKLFSGLITRWEPDNLRGTIEPSADLLGMPQEIEVESISLSRNTDSERLVLNPKVNFNFKIVQKDGKSYFRAHNVTNVTPEPLHQGKIKAWLGSYGFIESSDFQKRIRVTTHDFQDKQSQYPIEQDQRVEFEIAKTVKGQDPFAINVKRVK